MSSEPYVPTMHEMRRSAGTENPYGCMDPEEFNRGVAKIRADALREAADDINARVNSQGLIDAVDRWGGYYGGIRTAMQNEETALRLRADRIEKEERGERRCTTDEQ